MKKEKMSNITKAKIIVAIIMVAIFIPMGLYIFWPSIKVNNYTKYLNTLKREKENNGIVSLYSRNSDFNAWIECKDLDISLPIMSSDDDYYLYHNFDKEVVNLGTPYINTQSVFGQSSNTSITGHSVYVTTGLFNRKTTHSIFGRLSEYLYASHDFNYKITIETLTQKYNYKVFSAFKFNTNKDCQEQTWLYNTTEFTCIDDFNEFSQIALSRSSVDFGLTAQYGDKFLTLYTCSTTEGYRIMVIAKQV